MDSRKKKHTQNYYISLSKKIKEIPYTYGTIADLLLCLDISTEGIVDLRLNGVGARRRDDFDGRGQRKVRRWKWVPRGGVSECCLCPLLFEISRIVS